MEEIVALLSSGTGRIQTIFPGIQISLGPMPYPHALGGMGRDLKSCPIPSRFSLLLGSSSLQPSGLGTQGQGREKLDKAGLKAAGREAAVTPRALNHGP